LCAQVLYRVPEEKNRLAASSTIATLEICWLGLLHQRIQNISPQRTKLLVFCMKKRFLFLVVDLMFFLT